MFTSELRINRFLLGYARKLVADLDDARMTEQPLPGVNHPAWILGHLAFSADRARNILGEEKLLPPEWTTQYGPGSKVTGNRTDYPSRDTLLGAVETGFEKLRAQVVEVPAAKLAEPNPNPFTKDVLLTLGDAASHLMTSHLALHLGQLSAWRRMIGLPHLF